MRTLAAPPTTATPPEERVGWLVRHTHPYGFRCGEWAQIMAVQRAETPPHRGEYVVCFPDGIQDVWVVQDPCEPYEFAVVVA